MYKNDGPWDFGALCLKTNPISVIRHVHVRYSSTCVEWDDIFHVPFWVVTLVQGIRCVACASPLGPLTFDSFPVYLILHVTLSICVAHRLDTHTHLSLSLSLPLPSHSVFICVVNIYIYIYIHMHSFIFYLFSSHMIAICDIICMLHVCCICNLATCPSPPWGRRSSGTALRRGERLATTLGGSWLVLKTMGMVTPVKHQKKGWRTPSPCSDMNKKTLVIRDMCVFHWW